MEAEQARTYLRELNEELMQLEEKRKLLQTSIAGLEAQLKLVGVKP